MSGASVLPAVDEEPRGGFAALLEELRPRPGRLAGTMRLVALVLATVAIAETFRMPEIAVSAYVVLFVSRAERASTVTTAVVAGAAVILAVFAAIVVFMASLSEPAVRVPMIAVATFAALFVSRVSPLGPAAFAAGFILAYGLTLGDQVLGLALQSSDVSNTVGPGAPELLSIPPEEALLHFLLWLAPVVAMPVALVVVGNLLTGQRPEQLLRDGLAGRLAACAGFCAGERGAERALLASAREGTAGFAKLLHLSGITPDTKQRRPDYASLIRETEQVAVALLAWRRVASPEDLRRALTSCADGFRAAAQSLQHSAPPATQGLMPPDATTAAARPLAAEVSRASDAILRALSASATPPAAAKGAARHLISAEAARNPETARYALKVTLAVMLSYAAESLLDWPAIHTCVVTCFFVSLGTIGESVHKAALRITGALIGGALGIATILLLMPVMTDLGQLLLAVAAATMLAGWIATGSERISYAGWQIGLAYYLTVLQGYGPTLDMQTARDRVVGIVLGNLIVLVVFTTLWPVSLAQAVRQPLSTAIAQLGAYMRLERQPPAEAAAVLAGLQAGFLAATNGARALVANTGLEPASIGRTASARPIDNRTIAALEAVMVVISVILNLRFDPAWAAAPESDRQGVLAYHEALADWFGRCAAWVRTGGAEGEALVDSLPMRPRFADPPGGLASHLAARAAWYDILDADLHGIMEQVVFGRGRTPAEALPRG